MIEGIVNYFKCLFHLRGCMDVHRLLFEYAEGTLDAQTQRDLEKHLKDCPACLEYLTTYRRTIKATHECCRCHEEIPADLRAKLETFIREKL